jgi:hypothetical protein
MPTYTEPTKSNIIYDEPSVGAWFFTRWFTDPWFLGGKGTITYTEPSKSSPTYTEPSKGS